MDVREYKCVLIIDNELSVGFIANVSSILSITLGSKIQGLIGPDVTDREGVVHQGLTRLPIPVLGTTSNNIRMIRQEFLIKKTDTSFLVDFSSFAQQARTYEEYQSGIEAAETNDIIYLGIALFGDKKSINKATKGLALIGNDRIK